MSRVEATEMNQPAASPSAADAGAPAQPQRRRWLRRAAIGAGIACLLVALGLWMVTRSWFIIWQLRPVLERKLGGEVTIARAVYHGHGSVTFEDICLRARDVRGPAAEILRIRQAQVVVDLASLLTGSIKLDDARLSGITARVSEDLTQNNQMNLMSLHPRGGGGGATRPPERVRIDDLTLEVGMHINDQFILNGQRSLAGEMHPVEGNDDWYSYELAEVDEHGRALGESGLFIKGEWNARTTQASTRIEAITLDDRLQMMLPRQARLWWTRMQLIGQVDAVRIDWSPSTPLTVRFGVKDIAMTMPVDLGEVWSVYRDGAIEPTTSRPRMFVHSGVIRVATDSLVLEELRGELVSANHDAQAQGTGATIAPSMVGVPYEISLIVPQLPPIDWNAPDRWMEDALKTSAFDLTARLDNFSLSKIEGGDAQAVGLPSIVAKVLAKFKATNWVLSTNVRVVRGNPTPDDGGLVHAAPLQVSGQAYINDATGSYHKFPYVLEDVDAYLRFTDQRVDVEYLQARGPVGSTFRVSGFIEPPDKDSRVHMEVTGFNVPLDDRLRAAFKPKELQAFDALFHRPSAERMARAGILPDAGLIAEQVKGRATAAESLAALRRTPDPDRHAVAHLEALIESLDRSIKAGPFVTGGMGDVQLTVERPPGPGKQTTIAGYIDIKNAGLIFDRFPYPLRGTGRLRWEPDRVSIDTTTDPAGIRFVTPAGGAGAVTGSVGFPKSDDGGRMILPDLRFVIEDDPVNPAIFAAIPYGKSELAQTPSLEKEWPGPVLSRSARIVRGIGLMGSYDYDGHIGVRDDGKFDWDFRVSLDGGTAAPNALLADAIRARDLPWPGGLLLTDLKGEVRVQRSGVTWDNVAGHSSDTEVSTTGAIDLRSRAGADAADSVLVRLKNAPVDRSALNMISRANAGTAEQLWNRYQPMGRVDAEILWRSDAPPGEAGVLTFSPRSVNVLVGGERVNLDPVTDQGAGAVRIDGNAVRFDAIALQLSSLGAPDGGVLTLDGRWQFAGPTPNFSIAGQWRHGRLESTVIPEALRVFGQAPQARRYSELAPAGLVNLTYEIARAAPDAPPQYRFEIDPREVEFTLRGTRVNMSISGGHASITPGVIALNQITGAAANGQFSVDGAMTTIGPLDMTLEINYTGQMRSDDVAAFLPAAVNDSLAALEFRDGTLNGDSRAVSRLNNGRLHLRQSGTVEESHWQTAFTGNIEFTRASFVAGVTFSDVDGGLDLDVAHESGQPLLLTGIGKASRATVFGQSLTDLEAPITMNAQGDALEIPAARARSGDGEVACSAVAGVLERRDYRMRLDLVGVPLGNMLTPRPEPENLVSAATQAVNSAVRGTMRGIGELVAPDSRSQPPATPSALSGQVYASLTLAGERGDAASKRGRGIFRVINGRLSAIPLALQAMQVMQLTLPLTGELDYADADMYVIGDTAHFEHILFESSVGGAAALQLRGEGTLDLLTMNVAARFRPRSGVAILRDIIGGIGDILYEIELTGPLRDPMARIVPLP